MLVVKILLDTHSVLKWAQERRKEHLPRKRGDKKSNLTKPNPKPINLWPVEREREMLGTSVRSAGALRLLGAGAGTLRGLAGSAGANTLKTALYDEHLRRGAKVVDFAGYWLPLQYPQGVKAETEFTRSSATLFDVSHMGQEIGRAHV